MILRSWISEKICNITFRKCGGGGVQGRLEIFLKIQLKDQLTVEPFEWKTTNNTRLKVNIPEKESESKRARAIEKEREKESERKRVRERERKSEKESERKRAREGEREKESERKKAREREREKESEGKRARERLSVFLSFFLSLLCARSRSPSLIFSQSSPLSLIRDRRIAHIPLPCSDQYRDICKYGVWGPVEWVGDQLTGWGGSSQKPNSK